MKAGFLASSILFKDTPKEQLSAMLTCLGAYEKSYKKGQVIYHVGSCVDAIGVVLTGSVNIENDDIWGNKSILDHIEPGQIFAETYACIPNAELLVNVVATENCHVLFLKTSRVLHVCPNTCSHHSALISNLLTITAQKNLKLSQRILYTSAKTIRGRLLAYFYHQSIQHGCLQFTIPFNRQQLADFLGVDRSAMSNELSKMKDDGLIAVNKNTFILNKTI